MAKLVLYEDEKATNFLPISYTRPVYDVKCGALTLREKAETGIEHEGEALFCRPYLAEVMRERTGLPVNDRRVLEGEVVLVNGRAVVSSEVVRRVEELEPGKALVNGKGELVAAKVEDGAKLGWLTEAEVPPADAWKGMGLEVEEVEALVLEYLWEIPVLLEEGEVIADDIERISKGKRRGTPDEKVVVYGEKLFVEEGAKVLAGVVIDTEEGPVYIAKGARITPPTFIEGPTYIGPNCRVDGAKLRPGTVLGEVCYVGGEVEASVIHSYTNKHHDGFIGHAYLGQWVNIGAMTTNSDLKNNYSPVRVWVNGKMVDTGELKIGCFIGDHTKVGIGVMMTTGAVIGVSANVYGSETTPKFVPSFSWGNVEEGFVVHDLEKAVLTARRMTARRKVELTKAEEELLRKVFEMTEWEREQAGVKAVKAASG